MEKQTFANMSELIRTVRGLHGGLEEASDEQVRLIAESLSPEDRERYMEAGSSESKRKISKGKGTDHATGGGS